MALLQTPFWQSWEQQAAFAMHAAPSGRHGPPPQTPSLHACEQQSAFPLHIAPAGAHIIEPLVEWLLLELELTIPMPPAPPVLPELTDELPVLAIPPWDDDEDEAVICPLDPPAPPAPPGLVPQAVTATASPSDQRKVMPVRRVLINAPCEVKA